MKNKKLERFSKRTGIVNIDHNDENVFVVYSYFFDLPKLNNNELGQSIGKGKTAEEALKNAIVYLADSIMRLENNLEKLENDISKIIRNTPREKEKIILPIMGVEDVYDEKEDIYTWVESKEPTNADIGIDEHGNIYAFIA